MYPKTEVFFREDNDWTSADAEQILRDSFSALDNYLTDYENLFLAEMATFGDETILTLAGMVAKITQSLGGDVSSPGAKFALENRQEAIDEGRVFVYADCKDFSDLPDSTWMEHSPEARRFAELEEEYGDEYTMYIFEKC